MRHSVSTALAPTLAVCGLISKKCHRKAMHPCAGGAVTSKQTVEDLVLNGLSNLLPHLALHLHPCGDDGRVYQVSDDLVNIPPMEAHLCELCGLYLCATSDPTRHTYGRAGC